MKIKRQYRYALVTPTSMGVRLSPVQAEPLHCATDFRLTVTSAETNAATILSCLGMPVKVLTAFVKGSPVAQLIKANLRSRNMDYEGKEVEPDGPWGCRHQINMADTGFGVRGPRVYNDRAGEVGRLLCKEDFDLERLFGQDGVAMLHISGLIAALSPKTSELCIALAQVARQYGTLVSFDLNYRASFWKGREAELRDSFTQIASQADILVGNEEDLQLCLGESGPMVGGKELSSRLNDFQQMISAAKAQFPHIHTFVTTLREVRDANTHLWGAMMLHGSEWQRIEPRQIAVLDRIGGGDGFVGGLLYAILKEWPSERQLQFAWGAGALATTFHTDYAQPADESQIWEAWKGNARIFR